MGTLLFLSAGSLLGGTAIVETIFMWNGVGKMAVDAVSMHDIPVIQAYLVWMAAIYLLLHLIDDLLRGCTGPYGTGSLMVKKDLQRPEFGDPSSRFANRVVLCCC